MIVVFFCVFVFFVSSLIILNVLVVFKFVVGLLVKIMFGWWYNVLVIVVCWCFLFDNVFGYLFFNLLIFNFLNNLFIYLLLILVLVILLYKIICFLIVKNGIKLDVCKIKLIWFNLIFDFWLLVSLLNGFLLINILLVVGFCSLLRIVKNVDLLDLEGFIILMSLFLYVVKFVGFNVEIILLFCKKFLDILIILMSVFILVFYNF